MATENGWLEERERCQEVGGFSRWRQRLRTYVVTHGIQVMCGSTGDVSAAAATDVPLINGAVRLAWLKALHAVGVTKFVATSGLGYDFVCYTGDLANFPFYYRRAYQAELELCAAWLHGEVQDGTGRKLLLLTVTQIARLSARPTIAEIDSPTAEINA